MAINTLTSTFTSVDTRPEISAKFVKAKKPAEQTPTSSDPAADSVRISSQATQATQGSSSSSVQSLFDSLADWGSMEAKPASKTDKGGLIDKRADSKSLESKPSGKKPEVGGPAKPTAQTKPPAKSSSPSKSSDKSPKA